MVFQFYNCSSLNIWILILPLVDELWPLGRHWMWSSHFVLVHMFSIQSDTVTKMLADADQLQQTYLTLLTNPTQSSIWISHVLDSVMEVINEVRLHNCSCDIRTFMFCFKSSSERLIPVRSPVSRWNMGSNACRAAATKWGGVWQRKRKLTVLYSSKNLNQPS